MAEKKRLWDASPPQYNDDRWDAEQTRRAANQSDPAPREPSDNGDERDERDIEELLRRPERPEGERDYECNDTTPIDYKKGPHDEEFGVEDHDFDEPDSIPINYDQGMHDQEFGVEDDDEYGVTDDEV